MTGQSELRLRNIVIDCNDLPRMAAFWSSLLSYEVLMREGDAALLAATASARPRIFLQKVPEPRRGKNRLHIDVDVPEGDLDGAVARAEALGAEKVESFASSDGAGWWVLADPEGNLFCITSVPGE